MRKDAGELVNELCALNLQLEISLLKSGRIKLDMDAGTLFMFHDAHQDSLK